MIYCPFDKPEFNKTAWVAGQQHYLAGTWRDRTWILTDRGKHIRGKPFSLLVSADGYGALCNGDGDFAGDPFKIPDATFTEITGQPPVANSLAT